jgi:undecaprenyl-diphosphatase
VTILAGLAVGLRLAAAVEFSFLLGVVVLTGVTLVDVLKHGKVMVHTYGAASLTIGCLAAAVSAAVAVKWMVSYLRTRSLAIFGWERIAAAGITIVLLVTSVI